MTGNDEHLVATVSNDSGDYTVSTWTFTDYAKDASKLCDEHRQCVSLGAVRALMKK